MAGVVPRRSFNHGAPFKYVNFRVRIPNQEGNLVCLAGSGNELGNWDPRGARVMHLEAENNIWCCNVMLSSPEVYRYRYFVCRPLWHEVKDRCSKDDILKDASGISLLFWESNVVCRLIQTRILPEQFDMPIVDFSVRYHHYSEWTRGWLFDTDEIRLRIAGKNPIEITSLPAGKNILFGIRCTPKNFNAMSQPRNVPAVLSKESGVKFGRLANAATLPISSFYTGICGPGNFNNPVCKDNESPFCGDIFMSKLDGVKCIPALQEAGGILCCPHEFITFNVNTCNAASLGFRFEIYDISQVKHKLIGYTYILPVGKWRSRQKVLIYCKNGKEIGYLTVDTLYFTPTPNTAMDMKISYQNHWNIENKHRRSADEVDYVLGPNFAQKRIVSVLENTMASVIAAANKPVDFIHLQVQLSKDEVPVLYHSFNVTFSSSRRCQETETYHAPVKNLTVDQLQCLQLMDFSSPVKKLMESHDNSIGFSNLVTFPTLSSCMEVRKNVGFVIEIMYPRQLENGQLECGDYCDGNRVVDIVLKTVFELYAHRKVILVSSDADTCVMLQKKQNRFPVMFKVQDSDEARDAMYDFRSRSMGAALEFAVSEKLLGVILPAKDLLEDANTLSRALSMGLVVLVWIDRALSPAMTSSMVRMRIDGIFSERIDFSLNCRTTHEVFQLPLKEREKLRLPYIIFDGGLEVVPRFPKTKGIGAGVCVEN